MALQKKAQKIVEQTNALARTFYAMQGYQVSEGYRFDKAHHPQERGCWNLACAAQQHLKAQDPNMALALLGEPLKPVSELLQERMAASVKKPKEAQPRSAGPLKKVFRTQDNVGKVRYTVSFHDGIKTHRDGSPFFDLSTFTNKTARDRFIQELEKQGYVPATN